MVDTTDLKSVELYVRVGSSPTNATNMAERIGIQFSPIS